MNYCNECIHEYSPIKLEPCRSCVLTNAHPSFEAKPPKIVTNEEWIRGWNKNQIAEYFCDVWCPVRFEPVDKRECKCKIVENTRQDHRWLLCKECWLEWLEQEHKE